MEKKNIKLQGVMETMLVPVVARAIESKRKKPNFYDKYALEVLDKINYDFTKHSSKMSIWGIASRTIIIDREVKKFLEQNPKCTVINIACGLDARFYRVDNGKIMWYNIDFPEVMDIRKEIFPVSERVTNIASSVLDFSWIDKVEDKTNILIIAEGILMYFTEEEVALLFEKIYNNFTNVYVICELMTEWMVKNQKLHETIKKTTAIFRWGIKETLDFMKICPNYKMLGDYNLTYGMREYSPIFITLIFRFLKRTNNRIGVFIKI